MYNRYLGRKFEQGNTDCYDLIRDFYYTEFGIELTNYARPKDWWLEDQFDLYIDNYEKEGFEHIKDLKDIKKFDIILIAIPDPRSKLKKTKTNHAGIYLGDNKILHHRYGKLSQISPYDGWLRHATTHIIRHPLTPRTAEAEQKTIDVMDLILPHKKRLLEEYLSNDGDA